MYIIETKDLTKVYSNRVVVNKINMHVKQGDIYGFVGENGSGKTTIMRLLTGLAEPNGGSFSLFGVNNKNSEIYKVRKKLSAIVETTSLVPTMTARENIIFQELYLGIKLTEEERLEYLRKVHLEEVGNKKVRNFSLGMKQRLGIALALINKPSLMLLDEPMNGLDPQGIAELRDLLIELNKNDHITVLISSHILSELEKIATTYGFISHGKLLEEISVEELQSKCRKSLQIKVEHNGKSIENIVKILNLKDYKILPNGEIIIYDEVDVGKAVNDIYQQGIKILAINSSDENVEDYYLNLIRGVK